MCGLDYTTASNWLDADEFILAYMPILDKKSLNDFSWSFVVLRFTIPFSRTNFRKKRWSCLFRIATAVQQFTALFRKHIFWTSQKNATRRLCNKHNCKCMHFIAFVQSGGARDPHYPGAPRHICLTLPIQAYSFSSDSGLSVSPVVE